MGQTIARARKGISASDGATKLAYNTVNENLLNQIIGWLQSYSSAHPGESKIKFKSVMTWPTSLTIQDFSGGAYEQRGDDMVSTETIGKENHPVIRLHKDSDGLYKMSIYTLADLAQVVNIAGNRKLDETRACLEANHDPIALMAGDRFSAVNGEDLSAYRYMEEIMKSGKEEESEESEEKKLVLRLVMHVQKLDQDLLQQYAEAISATMRLTPALVEQDVHLLKEFCGDDEELHVLEDILFTTDHKFQNGCRAPSSRQIHGDISYIHVKPHDEDPFFVTASTMGYFVNKGWIKEKADYDYQQVGDVCPNLVELIKSKSQKFAQLIEKQSWDKFNKVKSKKKPKNHGIGKPQTVANGSRRRN